MFDTNQEDYHDVTIYSYWIKQFTFTFLFICVCIWYGNIAD